MHINHSIPTSFIETKSRQKSTDNTIISVVFSITNLKLAVNFFVLTPRTHTSYTYTKYRTTYI